MNLQDINQEEFLYLFFSDFEPEYNQNYFQVLEVIGPDILLDFISGYPEPKLVEYLVSRMKQANRLDEMVLLFLEFYSFLVIVANNYDHINGKEFFSPAEFVYHVSVEARKIFNTAYHTIYGQDIPFIEPLINEDPFPLMYFS